MRSDDNDERSLSIGVFERDSFKRTIDLIAATQVHRIFVMDNEEDYHPIRVISISDILRYIIS